MVRNSFLKLTKRPARTRLWLIRTPDLLHRLKTARISPEFNNPAGVPISAIIFGGRRASTTPLVYQSFDWTHGTYMGSAVSSETTAAATGAVGVLRHDPMAMKPFIGYNVGDYWAHWLEMGKILGDKAPKIFNVNWFKQDEEGNFLWPGFGDNMRVLDWIIKRCEGTVDAVETAIGYLPKKGRPEPDWYRR